MGEPRGILRDLDGCPTFARAYAGRKSRAELINRFYSYSESIRRINSRPTFAESSMEENLQLPAGYQDLLYEIKERIRSAHVQAALSVNRELVLLFWSIGRDLSRRFESEGWGISRGRASEFA
jgi:hypothetical protein